MSAKIGLRLTEKCSEFRLMVFEKIIRQNVEQAVSLFKQTNSLFYAFASKFFVGFNFQRPLGGKSPAKRTRFRFFATFIEFNVKQLLCFARSCSRLKAGLKTLIHFPIYQRP